MSTTSPRPCPICRKPRSPDHAPFCSQRCKDRDLARWFGDGYAVPGPPADARDFHADINAPGQRDVKD